MATYPLGKSEEASFHYIRLWTKEKPHRHETHKLIVFMLSGQAEIHFGDKTYPIEKGDMMEIPKGAVHWAENKGSGPAEVYAIFMPPYDGKDFKPVS